MWAIPCNGITECEDGRDESNCEKFWRRTLTVGAILAFFIGSYFGPLKSKLSKRKKAPKTELKSKDSSNICLSPEERGYLALKLRTGGKFVAEKILQLIKEEETNPFTYLKVSTFKSKVQGVLKFCDFTICDPCYFMILFRPQFCEFMILKKRSKHNMFWIFFF